MTRLERVHEQITRTKSKIAEHTERLRELEKQRTEIENGDILKMIHGFNVSKDELQAFLQNREKEGGSESYDNSQAASFNTKFEEELG